LRVLPRTLHRKFSIPLPTATYRRKGWFDFQLALDPLAAPKGLRRAAEQGRPRNVLPAT